VYEKSIGTKINDHVTFV